MSTNVHYLFAKKPEPVKTVRPPVDITGLILAVTNWAEEQGVDVYNDAAFQIRVGDLMAHLQIMAHKSREAA